MRHLLGIRSAIYTVLLVIGGGIILCLYYSQRVGDLHKEEVPNVDAYPTPLREFLMEAAAHYELADLQGYRLGYLGLSDEYVLKFRASPSIKEFMHSHWELTHMDALRLDWFRERLPTAWEREAFRSKSALWQSEGWIRGDEGPLLVVSENLDVGVFYIGYYFNF